MLEDLGAQRDLLLLCPGHEALVGLEAKPALLNHLHQERTWRVAVLEVGEDLTKVLPLSTSVPQAAAEEPIPDWKQVW